MNDQTSRSDSDRSHDQTSSTTVPPTDAPQQPERAWAPSLVLVNTGDGKGKTTAALGTCMRAHARGWKVGVVQFLKSEEWKVGEEDVGRELGFDWWALGDGFTWDSEDLDRSAAVAQEAWRHAKGLIEAGEHEVVMLDEVTYPMNYGWVDADEVVATIRDRPDHVHVLCTGRDAPQALVDAADTVTEMRKIKHAYDSGIMARRGIDY